MSQRAVLEVIALGVEDAVAARAGGADRLELVTDMAADGLTPTVAAFARIRAAVDIPLRVMLRLADGFGAGDVDRLAGVAGELRGAGAEEFVLGFLRADGGVDLAAVERVVGEIDGCRWTFHRAIDHAVDRDAVRKQLDGLARARHLSHRRFGGRGRRRAAHAARGGGAGWGAGVRAAVAGGGWVAAGACAAAAGRGGGRVSYRGCGSAGGVGEAGVGGGGRGVAGGVGFAPAAPTRPILNLRAAAPRPPHRP